MCHLGFECVNIVLQLQPQKLAGNAYKTGHRNDAIFTGLRTAAELPSLNLNDTRYTGVVCFREDAGLLLFAIGIIIGRPKKSKAGCGVQSSGWYLYRIRE